MPYRVPKRLWGIPFIGLGLVAACSADEASRAEAADGSASDAVVSEGEDDAARPLGDDAAVSPGIDAAPPPATDAAPPPANDAAPPPANDAAPPPSPDAALASPGCGRAPVDAPGGVQLEADFGPEAGGRRSYHLVLPADYDPAVPHRLVFGYAGTNWTGAQIRPYLDLEDPASSDIYVYPDVLWRDFEGWGNLGGWLLGPHARPAHGDADLVFTAALLDRLSADYCIDPDQVFATGHSWGGDFAAVLGCFLGDRFRGVAPIAANRPYWFEPPGGVEPGCVGRAAVWTFFSQNDDHFTGQPYPGAYGDEQDAFWRRARGCEGADVDLAIGAPRECVEHTGCEAPVRYCLYDPSTGHQRPAYFPAEFRRWLETF
jgi:polyhydroxybutyrate depolymerase